MLKSFYSFEYVIINISKVDPNKAKKKKKRTMQRKKLLRGNWKKATHSYKLSKLIDDFHNEIASFVNVKQCNGR